MVIRVRLQFTSWRRSRQDGLQLDLESFQEELVFFTEGLGRLVNPVVFVIERDQQAIDSVFLMQALQMFK